MTNEFEFQISPEDSGTRLDRALSRLVPASSRSFLQKLIKDGLVRLDGKIITLPRFPVKCGMMLQISIPEIDNSVPSPEPFEFPIVYEDDVMLVINKPAGVVVHPGAGNPDGTVVNALLGRYPDMAESFSCMNSRPGIVHRLDKETSGCLIIAKTPDAQYHLSNSFAEHKTHKTYLAVCAGVPGKKSGELCSLIGRHPVNRQKMAIVERNGKNAITSYTTLGKAVINNKPLALMSVNIATGRTHQIRVHMSSIKLPVVGDALYGGKTAEFPGIERQLLHAWKISIPHPVSGEILEFTAEIPDDLKQVALQIVPQTEL